MLLEKEPQLASSRNPLVPLHEGILFSAELGADVHDSARVLLTETLYPVVNAVCEFLRSQACIHNIPVYNVTLYGHTSYDDGSEHIMITQIVDVPMAEAFAYRKQMYKAYNPWFGALSVAYQSAIQNNIVPAVLWRSNGAAH